MCGDGDNDRWCTRREREQDEPTGTPGLVLAWSSLAPPTCPPSTRPLTNLAVGLIT
uniref:Uncharacterized protein n=1 Tax=Arundo donax TaxID=35708 RepID=A0A0A8YHJ4_ARUDO